MLLQLNAFLDGALSFLEIMKLNIDIITCEEFRTGGLSSNLLTSVPQFNFGHESSLCYDQLPEFCFHRVRLPASWSNFLVSPYRSRVSSARHLGKPSLFLLFLPPGLLTAHFPSYTFSLKVAGWGLLAAHIFRHFEMAKQTRSGVPSSA